MKIIKNLNVTVKYSVKLTDVEVPDDVYEQFLDCSDFSDNSFDNDEAFDWLRDNIKEEDSFSLEYEVDDFVEL